MRSSIHRFSRVFSRRQQFTRRLVSSVKVNGSSFLVGGGSASFALTLFNSSKEENSPPKSSIANFDIVVREVDTLYETYLIDNAYSILRRYENCTESELLWRLARILCEKGKMATNQAEKKEHIMRAYTVVKKAVENEPIGGCFGAHKWLAIILDYVGEIEGTKARIMKSYDVRKHLERAIEINANDATTWHILGIWHYTFADMPYLSRMAASAIFGKPPTSTYQEALEQFLKAEEIQPNFYSTNLFYIGETYVKLGRQSEAIPYYKRAFMMPVITVDDQQTHVKAHERLRHHKVSDSELLQHK